MDPDIDVSEVDPAVRKELTSLPETLADKVAAHLVMAARALDDDADLALAHARRAHDLAPRISAVREALAIAAYRTGDYRTALREARTVHRMGGGDSWLPMIADCERGLGRSERALDLLLEADLAAMSDEDRAECLIVLSGARRDLGQADAALAVLDDDLLRTAGKSEWSARLRLAYAEALAETGRHDEAERWLRLAVASDVSGASGAADVLAEWEGVELVDTAADEAEPVASPERTKE